MIFLLVPLKIRIGKFRCGLWFKINWSEFYKKVASDSAIDFLSVNFCGHKSKGVVTELKYKQGQCTTLLYHNKVTLFKRPFLIIGFVS